MIVWTARPRPCACGDRRLSVRPGATAQAERAQSVSLAPSDGRRRRGGTLDTSLADAPSPDTCPGRHPGRLRDPGCSPRPRGRGLLRRPRCLPGPLAPGPEANGQGPRGHGAPFDVLARARAAQRPVQLGRLRPDRRGPCKQGHRGAPGRLRLASLRRPHAERAPGSSAEEAQERGGSSSPRRSSATGAAAPTGPRPGSIPGSIPASRRCRSATGRSGTSRI